MSSAAAVAGPVADEKSLWAGHRLLGISGSLRAQAHSTAVLQALLATCAPGAALDYADIGALPHFNQDLYAQPLPEAVTRLRDQITGADALVIASPEYNHGIPGVLKNALDWASRPHNSSPLRDKPVLIVTSSLAFTGGVRAQYQIRETVISALACPVNTPEIIIGEVGAKITDGRFQDHATLAFAGQGFQEMLAEVKRDRGRASGRRG